MVWWCQLATEFVNELSPFFKRLTLVRLPGRTSHRAGNARHDVSWQLDRRRGIALARNRLLTAALSLVADHNVNWVLWLDVDVRHIPRDLIRHLLSANQSIVVPNCLWKQDNGQVRRPILYALKGERVSRQVSLGLNTLLKPKFSEERCSQYLSTVSGKCGN